MLQAVYMFFFQFAQVLQYLILVIFSVALGISRTDIRLIEKNTSNIHNTSALLLNNSTGLQTIENKTIVTLTTHNESVKEEVKNLDKTSLKEEEKSTKSTVERII